MGHTCSVSPRFAGSRTRETRLTEFPWHYFLKFFPLTKSWANQLLNSSAGRGNIMISAIIFTFAGLNSAIPSVFGGALG